MIRIFIDPTNEDKSMSRQEVTVSGPVIQVAAEIGFAIADIYNGLKRRNPEIAESFRLLMEATTHRGSPTWKTDTDVPGGTAITLVGDEVRRRKDVQ